MDEIPPYVGKLIQDGRVALSGLSARARRDLKPLFAGGALIEDASGRGSVVVVRRPDVLLEWARQQYPVSSGEWTISRESDRARSVLIRRASKAGGAAAGATVLHVRAIGDASMLVDGVDFPVAKLTSHFGVTACLVRSDTRLALGASALLVENLACFLAAEAIVPTAGIAMNSSGKISDALIRCLARSSFTSTLLHLPDYDPVGLADYLRLKSALGDRVSLYVPPDVEARFAAFGNKGLITGRPRNRSLLESLGTTIWPCRESSRIFNLVRESGSGLEQESLLLSRDAAGHITQKGAD